MAFPTLNIQWFDLRASDGDVVRMTSLPANNKGLCIAEMDLVRRGLFTMDARIKQLALHLVVADLDVQTMLQRDRVRVGMPGLESARAHDGITGESQAIDG